MFNKVKIIIKRIPGIHFIFRIKDNMDFNRDKKFFLKHYMYSKKIAKNKIEYEMLLEVHKLEKGFAVINPRPFGIDKVRKIMNLIIKFEELYTKKSFSYNLSCSSLKEYLLFYEKHNWTNTEQYVEVKDFLEKHHDFEYIKAGAYDLKKEDFIKDSMINYEKFLVSRRSVRNYKNKKMEEQDVVRATQIAINTPSACNRQMCKVYYIKDENLKKSIEKYAQGLGLFELENANFAIITFDVAANYFIGERNQGWFNAGLFTTNFINALHSLGIGSCCVQWGNSFKEEKEFKQILNIPDSERIAVIITFGYYDDVSRIPYSTRKTLEEIYEMK